MRAETPDDRARLAAICGFAVMIPTRGPGLMRMQPPAEEVWPYLELGLACAGEGDSEALVLLLASQGYWEFGYGVDPADESGERCRAAAERAREAARRLGRPDLELIALDSLSAGLNIRGLYGHAEPIDRERLELARTLRDPFEVGDSFYTAAWSALAIGLYSEVIELNSRRWASTSRRSGTSPSPFSHACRSASGTRRSPIRRVSSSMSARAGSGRRPWPPAAMEVRSSSMRPAATASRPTPPSR